MTDLAALSRHWMRQTELDRGIRLDAEQLALLNALGVGELILGAVGRKQREQCLRRTTAPINGGLTGLGETQSETERSERLSGKSSGMTNPREGSDPGQRARRRSRPQKMRSTGTISNANADKPSAPHAGGHLKAVEAIS